jgi:uncharacterized protein
MDTQNFKTVVIGASEKTYRYSHSAVLQLQRHGYPVVAIGLRPGTINGVDIVTGFPEISDVHTVTLYIGPKNQPKFYNYIIEALNPNRVIFNPGTENSEFETLCREHGIVPVENCTLMMLSFGVF